MEEIQRETKSVFNPTASWSLLFFMKENVNLKIDFWIPATMDKAIAQAGTYIWHDILHKPLSL